MSDAGDSSERDDLRASVWLWLALIASIAALAGSLYLSLGMNLKACPLCFYQRTFAMSLVAVLLIGQSIGVRGLTFLTLPLATAGFGVACFHVFLEVTGKLECPLGMGQFGSAPQQSLAVYAVIFLLLFADGLRNAARHPVALLGSVALGALLAAASCISNPPMPARPTAPYASPPEICRPPFGPEQ